MKVLVCGLGSIGERHINNLLTIGYEDIVVYRKRNLPLRTLDREFLSFSSLKEALSTNPDVAFVCNPTHLHLSTALSCIDSGCHVFVEKPLSNSTNGLANLKVLAEQKSCKVMVGYMMRFHPCLQTIKKWIDAGVIGQIVYLRSQWGEYLPDWHPWEDYRTSYAASKTMGGGPGLTLSHELDTMLWLAGEYTEAVAMKNYASMLELETEHGIDLLIRFKTGATGNLHMDYFQSPPARTLEVIGTEGRLQFDYFNSMLARYKLKGEEAEEIYDVSQTFDRNDLFVNEIKYFLNAITSDSQVEPGIEEGIQVIHLLEEALRKT